MGTRIWTDDRFFGGWRGIDFAERQEEFNYKFGSFVAAS